MAADGFRLSVRQGKGCVGLVNERTKQVLASALELATTRKARRRGLLGREHLDCRIPLVLVPCWMIHTARMRFAIDAVFVDRKGRAIRIIRGLRPWRIAVSPRAYAVIEIASGRLPPDSVSVGDRLQLRMSTDAGA